MQGSNAIYQSLGGTKEILKEEQATIDFAYASVVAIRDIKKGDTFSKENIWVKRPGTGFFAAKDFKNIIGKVAQRNILKNSQIGEEDV